MEKCLVSHLGSTGFCSTKTTNLTGPFKAAFPFQNVEINGSAQKRKRPNLA